MDASGKCRFETYINNLPAGGLAGGLAGCLAGSVGGCLCQVTASIPEGANPSLPLGKSTPKVILIGSTRGKLRVRQDQRPNAR